MIHTCDVFNIFLMPGSSNIIFAGGLNPEGLLPSKKNDQKTAQELDIFCPAGKSFAELLSP
jgi:hypothetical protein